jgi:hypothetical protein
MKKLVFVLILIFVIGCKTSGPTSTITETDIHIGTEGLVMELNDNMPPDVVYSGDTFPVGVKLDNKGAYDIYRGILLLNVEKDLLESKQSPIKVLDIKGASFGNPKGDSETINFLLKSKDIGKEIETMTSNIILTTCYAYQTAFTDTICIDTDFYNLKNKVKACSAEDKTYGSGQGGPVSITKIESKMMQEDNFLKPVFLIYIMNEGNGGVISPEGVDLACSEFGVRKNDINKIDVEAYLASEGKKLNCVNSNIKLAEGENMIRCVLEDGVDAKTEPYSTVLKVVLNYGYTETISKSIEIKKLI